MPTTTPQGTVGYASLWVADVERAAEFYATVLGWTYSHSETLHRTVAGATPPHGIVSLDALPSGVWDRWPRHNTLFISHGVDDVDRAMSRVRAAGGQAGEATDEPHGRTAQCTDDQGMPFAIHNADDSVPPAGRSPAHGQLAYLTLEVADSAKARAFFGNLFGWTFTPGSVPDGWQIDGIRPMGGMHGEHDQPTVVPMYAVDDIASAITRVRDAGGTATDAERKPFGLMATCADDQGTRYYLGQLD